MLNRFLLRILSAVILLSERSRSEVRGAYEAIVNGTHVHFTKNDKNGTARASY